jgi:hypothetical protein
LWFAHHTNMTDGTMIKRIKAVPYKQDPWLSKYPKLAALLDDDQIFAPKGNVVTHNIAINCIDPIEKDIVPMVKQYGQVTNNTDIKDANFHDCSNMNNYLRSSAITKINAGIQIENFEKIGPHKNNSLFSN